MTPQASLLPSIGMGFLFHRSLSSTHPRFRSRAKVIALPVAETHGNSFYGS